MTRPLSTATAAAADVGNGKIVDYSASALQEANALTYALSEASKELRRRSEHTEFLLGELAHRSKNQLAVIMGMASQTAKHSTSTEEFISQFNRRIQGLAKSQDLMVQRQWMGAPLEALVRAHLDLFGSEQRAEITGPNLLIDGNAVQNIGFALHELATNSTKYGALATPGARLEIRWELTLAGRVHIHWIESGIALTEPTNQQGFGSLVIAKLVPQALQGTASIEFREGRLHWHLDIPDTFVLRDP
jgi:two-component sensor histidine kinase